MTDSGYYDYENGTRAYYRFATLLASYKEYQNFFTYDIYFTNIPTINDINNTINETDNIINENNNDTIFDLNTNNTYVKNEHIGLEKYKTGNNIMVLFIILIFVIILTRNR